VNDRDDKLLIFLIIGGIFLSFITAGICTSCPGCGKWFAATEDARQLLGERTYQDWETHDDPVYDNSGKQIGYTTRTEYFTVLEQKFHYWKHCSYCNHHWEHEGKEERRL
jgi:hypothetical protein